MFQMFSYLLMFLMGILLVCAQTLWASAIKNQKLLEASPLGIAKNLITSPRIWLGAIIYVCATGVYFLLLSKNKFYVVQVGMTAIAILFSSILATQLFHEKISYFNIAGMILIIIGLALVLKTNT